MKETVDLIIFGAGLFGCHAALHFAQQGRRVLLVERENHENRWSKASLVNQARVHSGHHYPRSIRTALMARDHRDRFLREHGDLINDSFTAYYAIDRIGTLTDAEQFARFCNKVGIQARRVERSDIFSKNRIDALFEVDEATFDPFVLRAKYAARISDSPVEIAFGTRPVAAELNGSVWSVDLAMSDGVQYTVEAPAVINATYANINAINRIFGIDEIGATHEISEVVLVHAPDRANSGLTVMDGPFLSIMPFGRSGLHSLTSVLYTHRAYSASNLPRFFCQDRAAECVPEALSVCSLCPAKPSSNLRKMVSQLGHYLVRSDRIFPHGSLHTVKTKLKATFSDDGRPTDIRIHNVAPFFASVFSGKINSVYEVEGINIDI